MNTVSVTLIVLPVGSAPALHRLYSRLRCPGDVASAVVQNSTRRKQLRGHPAGTFAYIYSPFAAR
jgi:hypothetical protein